MKRILRPFNVALFFASLLMMQCTDDSKKRFEDPPWLGGTNIETLEKGEKYTQFLALMDKAEYRTSIENQLFTLFVPSDSAFDAYLQKNGMSSVEELSREQAEELFAQHILINPRSREQLLYEYAWEVLETPEGEYGTLFHKKQTYSLPIDYFEEVKYNKTFQGQTLQIYRGRTLIPLFTTEYFNDYFGDPSGSDYLFMYPNSSWSGTQWHDAMVLNFEGTASGFIYYLDKVVEPIPTIETYLKNNQDKYGVFYDIAQQFADYVNASINEKNERRYQKTYVGISDFACEEGPARGDPQNMLYSFSAYIPTDNVLQEYLNNTVLKTYPDMLSVPELFKVYLLQSHIKTRLDLPSKIQKRFLNYYGDNVEIDINNDIHEVIMCSNGPVYVINRILEPNAFTCAPGPLFFNKSYSTFLYALEYSGVLTNLIKSDIDVTILAPSNDELNEMGIRQNELDGVVNLEIRNSVGVWSSMAETDIEELVKNYFYFGLIENFNGEGFIRMESDNYIYYNNGEIQGGGNQVVNDHNTIVETLPSEKNGNLFYLDNTIKKPLNAAERMMADPELSSFVDLLAQAGIIDSAQVDYELPGVVKPRLITISELDQWTILAPTNQAVADAELAGLIPADVEGLRDFIYYHFVRNRCIFDDGVFSGTNATHLINSIVGEQIVYETLSFSNAVHSLSITDGSGQTITVDHDDANKLMEFGVIHKINTVLQK